MNRRIALTVLLGVTCFAWRAYPADDKDILGTWEVQLSFVKLRVTYTAERKFKAEATTSRLGPSYAVQEGVWRLEHDEIVSQRELPELPPGSRSPEMRDKIIYVDAETLKIASVDATLTFKRKRSP